LGETFQCWYDVPTMDTGDKVWVQTQCSHNLLFWHQFSYKLTSIDEIWRQTRQEIWIETKMLTSIDRFWGHLIANRCEFCDFWWLTAVFDGFRHYLTLCNVTFISCSKLKKRTVFFFDFWMMKLGQKNTRVKIRQFKSIATFSQ
jgi:hypothetical protein